MEMMREGLQVGEWFPIIYKKLGQHRKKCRVCGKLIEDGACAQMRKVVKTNYYPVKGLMAFETWQFKHAGCE